MNVTFRQLQLFLALAKYGSISAAARACHVTQPTVSMQIKDLADSVGLPLYEQIGKRLHPTAAGEALVETAQAMTDEWADFGQRIAAFKGLTRGRLRIAVVSTAKYFVPRILGSFCKKYPEIDIALELLNRDGVVARLRDNRDDLYIMSMPPDDIHIELKTFLPNPLLIIASASHALARRKRIKIDDLKNERFILRESGSGTRLACDRHFSELGFSPKVRLELGSNEAIKQAVAGEMGIAVISRHALPAHPSKESLVILPVSGFPIHSNWSIIYPLGKRLSPIACEFLLHLEVACGEVLALLNLTID